MLFDIPLGTWSCIHDTVSCIHDLSLLNTSHLQGGKLLWLVSCRLGPTVKWCTLVGMTFPACLASNFGGCFCSGRRIRSNKDKEIKIQQVEKRPKMPVPRRGPTKQCPNWNGRVDGVLTSIATVSVPRRVFCTPALALDHWALVWPGSVCHPAYLRCLLAWW